jgi:hypothetical protein
LVIDMPSSAAQLLLTVARDLEVPVAYVTGLQMRRAADLYAGAAIWPKTPTARATGAATHS